MDKALEMLQQLAIKLGTTIEFLWGVLVKQQYIEAYKKLSLAGISIMAIIVCLFGLKWANKFSDEVSGYDEYSPRMFRKIIIWFALVLNIVLLVVLLMESILRLLNPEYYALKEIIGG